MRTAHYFVVMDEAPVKGNPTPKYDLMHGTVDDAIGYHVASGRTIRGLLAKVPAGEEVYRVYLSRTDGKTGSKRIR